MAKDPGEHLADLPINLINTPINIVLKIFLFIGQSIVLHYMSVKDISL